MVESVIGKLPTPLCMHWLQLSELGKSFSGERANWILTRSELSDQSLLIDSDNTLPNVIVSGEFLAVPFVEEEMGAYESGRGLCFKFFFLLFL